MDTILALLPAPPLAAAWLPVLLDTLVKAGVTLSAAGMLCLLLRRSSAATRHLVWSLGLTSLLVLPVLSLALPAWQVPVLPRLVSRAPVEEAAPRSEPDPSPAMARRPTAVVGHQIIPRPVPTPSGPPTQPGSAPTVHPDPPPPVPSSSGGLDWPTAAVLVWMVGAGLALLRLALGMARVWCVTRQGEPLASGPWATTQRELLQRIGISQRVGLLLTERVHVPMTWGVLSPVVLLPRGAEDWPTERRRVALLHELAHVKRWDYLTQMLGWLACALHWLNPLAWYALRRMRIERELACDDYVLNAGLRPSTYAQHLLEIARGLHSPCSVAAVAMARSSGLEGRVGAILEATRSRAAMTRLGMSVALVLALSVILPLSALRPVVSAERSRLRRDPELPGDYVTFTAKGRVVRPDGQPAAGAEVYLYRDFMGYHSDGSSGLRGETVSGPDGSFKLTGVRCHPADRTHRFRYDRIIAITEGLGAAIWTVDQGANAEPAITLELSEEAGLRGTVVDEDGEPIAGAHVRPYVLRLRLDDDRWASAHLMGEAFGPLTVTTDGDGRFALRHIPQAREARLRLSVRHPKFAEACRRIDLDSAEDELTIRLGVGGAIEGRVAHETSMSMEVTAIGFVMDGFLPRTVPTDEHGRYSIVGLPVGQYSVQVMTDHGEWSAEPKSHVPVDAGRTTRDVDFALVKAGTVVGKVVNETTGDPLPNVVVAIDDRGRTRTRTDGTFRTRARPGRRQVSIEDWRYPQGYIRQQPAREEVTVESGRACPPVTLRLRKGLTLTGTVVDTEGRPVPKAKVIPYVKTHIGLPNPWTNGQGEFTLHGVPPATAISFVAWSEALSGARAVEVGDQPMDDITIAVAPHAQISGRVVDSQGMPLRGMSVSCRKYVGRSAAGSSATHTDDDGWYEFTVCPGCQVHVRVRTSQGERRSRTLLAVAGQRHEMEDLVADPDFPVTISGVVVDPNGRPVPRARVECGTATVASDSRGEFSVKQKLTGRPIVVGARDAECRLSGLTSVTPSQLNEGIVISMVPAAGVTGRVVDDHGEPVPNALVRVLAWETSWFMLWYVARTDADGRYQVTGLPSNTAYRVTAQAKGYQRTSIRYQLEGGGTKELDELALQRTKPKTKTGASASARGKEVTIGKPAQLSIEDGTVSSSVSPHKGAAGDKPVRELVEGIDGFTLSSAAGQMFRHAKGDYRTEKLIPPELWHPSVRRLVAPLYVYNHGMHIVAVQKASEGREEGVYITNPWSSSYPVGNPAGFTLEKIDNHIFRFVRTRQQDKKQRQQ